MTLADFMTWLVLHLTTAPTTIATANVLAVASNIVRQADATDGTVPQSMIDAMDAHTDGALSGWIAEQKPAPAPEPEPESDTPPPEEQPQSADSVVPSESDPPPAPPTND